MNVDTQNHLAALRALLKYRLHELQTEVHAADLARRSSAQDDAVAEVHDLVDDARAATSSALAAGSEAHLRAEMHECEEALQRLDAGVFGDCSECGEPIDLQRLLVQPAAGRCAACQSAHEHRIQAETIRR